MPTPILMPALSPTMETGKLAKWHVKEGDDVKAGQVIAEIETDKATMEVEAVDEGKVGKILVPEGAEDVKVNAPIALLLGEGEDASALKGNGGDQKIPPPSPGGRGQGEGETATPSSAELARKSPPTPALPLKGGGREISVSHEAPPTERILASPLARRLAGERKLELAAIAGSGPRGRIVKHDVEQAVAKGPAAPRAAPAPAPRAPVAPSAERAARPLELPDPRTLFEPGSYEEIKHDAMRKAIARRLTLSKQTIPHYYLTVDCEIEALVKLRKDLNAKSPEGEGAYKLSVNDFVIRAVALALMKFPAANVTWTEDALLRHKHADVGVAVAIPGGLITPIIRHAELKGLAEISREMADLAERARTKKLKPNEFEGGSFAISNLGMFGVKEFAAVINPPHAAILAVGRGEERAVVKNGALAKAHVMTVTLSADHRAIDGATAAQFLQILRDYLEDPATMLL